MSQHRVNDQQALAVTIIMEEIGRAHGLPHFNEKENIITNLERGKRIIKGIVCENL